MSYVPISINTEPTDNLGKAFGISDERHEEIISKIIAKLEVLEDKISRSGICKLFVDEAATEAEAIFLSFIAGNFISHAELAE
jgi:hypothetical protein